MLKEQKVQALLETEDSWSTMWLKFDQQIYPFDKNFKAVSNYVINNSIINNKKGAK